MRARSCLALLLLAMPVALDAQRIPMPRIRDRGPATPAPLPPTARPIAREMSYIRMPFSVESYPLISHFTSPALRSSWTAGGAGTRVDLRLAPAVSLTLDMTSSFVGGPMTTQTVELGTRLRPPQSDSRWYPFLDVRAGYLNSYDRQLRPYDFVDPAFTATYSRMNHGLGGVVGTGVEYNLHPRWTITTSASYLRARLSPLYQDDRPSDYRYGLSAVRYTLGVRYNPGRWTMPPNLPQQITQ